MSLPLSCTMVGPMCKCVYLRVCVCGERVRGQVEMAGPASGPREEAGFLHCTALRPPGLRYLQLKQREGLTPDEEELPRQLA